MATLISVATGNFTTNTTWKVASAVANAEVDNDAGTFIVVTSNSDSTAFTPAATQVDGIAVKILLTVTPTGTFSVSFRNNTSPGTRDFTVTINASDLNATPQGWLVFKPGSPVTPNGTDSYGIRVVRSQADGAGNRITLYSSASTAATICREVILTTNAAPGAGDKLIVSGEYTGAGTGNNFTVTLDNTATTVFGAVALQQSVSINSKGTWTNGVAASTAYYFKWKGVFKVYAGGTMTAAIPPATSSVSYEMNSTSNVDTGFDFGTAASVTITGNTITNVSALLAANASAAATSLTTNVSTGWKNGDTIALASTTQTASECESKALTADAVGTGLTITAITNAHSGTTPTQAELINLTRNVKIFGSTTSLQGYIVCQTTSNVTLSYVEMYQLGSSGANKRGFDVLTTTGACSLTYCSIHDFRVASSIGCFLSGSAVSNVTFSNNVVYNIANFMFRVAAATSGTWTADSNIFIRNTDGSNISGVDLADVGGTFTNNTVVGSGDRGVTINESNGAIGTMTNITTHSNVLAGFITNVNIGVTGTITNLVSWRNASAAQGGINFQGINNLTVNTITAFGNNGGSIFLALGQTAGRLILTNVTSSGDTTFATTSGLVIPASFPGSEIYIYNSTFGVVTGIKTAHSSDIIFQSGGPQNPKIYLNYVNLASATQVSAPTNMGIIGFVAASGLGQTTGSHKTWKVYGTINNDSVIFSLLTPSERLTPNNASNKLESGHKIAAIANGTTTTVSVSVRKSVVGDAGGANYNGNQPRLIVKRNDAIGLTADTVLATGVAANGSWETLSGTTASATDDGAFEFYVDCDGTTGWVNDDNWFIS